MKRSNGDALSTIYPNIIAKNISPRLTWSLFASTCLDHVSLEMIFLAQNEVF